MVATYDNSASGKTTANSVTTSSTLTVSLAVAANSERYLLAACSFGNNGGSDATSTISATYNGVALTSKRKTHTGGSTNGFIEVFELLNPASGTNNLVFTCTAIGTATFVDMCGGGISYYNVDQTTPSTIGTSATGNSATASASITTVSTNNRVAWLGAAGNSLGTPTQTTRWAQLVDTDSAAGANAGQDAAATAGSQTGQWTIAAADLWAVVPVEILSSSGNSTGTIAQTQADQVAAFTGSNNTVVAHNWWIPGASLNMGTRLLWRESWGTYTGVLWRNQSLPDLYGGLSVPAGANTMAVTQANQTAAMTGAVTISGTIAVTAADQTMAASGVETISGTVAVTQADQTMAASGTEAISGTIAQTQANQTMAASGAQVINPTGTMAVTQQDQTMAASGVETISGTIAVTQANETMSASGFAGIVGTVAVTQADQTMSASGGETVTGTIAVTQANETMAATGTSGNSVIGTISVTQADQTMAASGTETISGTVATTQADQTMSATGSSAGAGVFASTQDNQTASMTGAVTIAGTIAVTQQNQTANASGSETITGTMASTQANQTMASGGTENIPGTIAVTQQDNVFIGLGGLTITGVLGATQANQTGFFIDVIPAPPTGTMGGSRRRQRENPKLPAVVN